MEPSLAMGFMLERDSEAGAGSVEGDMEVDDIHDGQVRVRWEHWRLYREPDRWPVVFRAA